MAVENTKGWSRKLGHTRQTNVKRREWNKTPRKKDTKKQDWVESDSAQAKNGRAGKQLSAKESKGCTMREHSKREGNRIRKGPS